MPWRLPTTLLTALLAVVAIGAGVLSAERVTTTDDHDVIGRFNIDSEAGGAVWSFQIGGELVIVGPGDLVARGTWAPTVGAAREFDAAVAVRVTGQKLQAMGEVAPDGGRIAMFVEATDATHADRGVPWPAESQLIGGRLGMTPSATPVPSAVAFDCQRPTWIGGGEVDWDRCNDADGSDQSSGMAASPVPSTSAAG